jgi:hypothetical protein
MRRIVIIAVLAAAVLVPVVGIYGKGSNNVTVNTLETGCSVSMHEWTGTRELAMSLSDGDRLLVNIDCEAGDVALTIRGADGREVYAGNGLADFTFTVGIPETGEYTVMVKGRRATGSVELRRIEG